MKQLSRLPTRTSARLRNQTWLMESSWYHSVTRKVTKKLSVLFYAKKVPCKSHKLPLFPIKSMTRKWALLKNNSDFSKQHFNQQGWFRSSIKSFRSRVFLVRRTQLNVDRHNTFEFKQSIVSNWSLHFIKQKDNVATRT